jgi:hypothetical protein
MLHMSCHVNLDRSSLGSPNVVAWANLLRLTVAAGLAQFNLQSISAVWRQNAVPLCYNEQEKPPLIKI